MAITIPNPTNAATDVPINATLAWADSVESDSYKVYFGTDTAKVTSRDDDVYRGDVTDLTYDPRVMLTYSTEYFWAIDAVLDGDVTSQVTNFSFTVVASDANISGKKYKKRLCALADDKFWYEDIDSQPSDMVELATTLTVASMTTQPAAGDILTQATSLATMTVTNSTATTIRGHVTGTWDLSHTFSSNDTGATMDEDTNTPTLISTFAPDTSTPIDMVEAYQKIFVVNGATKTVVDFTNTKIISNDAAPAVIDPAPTRGMILTAASGAKMTVDYWDGGVNIYGFNTTSKVFASGNAVTGTNADGGAVSFTMTAAAGVAPTVPHYYTWTMFGNETTTTDPDYKGALPALSTMLCRFRGRVVLAGNSNVPHSWNMTRQDDPFDLLFLEEDAASAVLGQNSALGQIGDVVVALMPYNDDYLIFGCSNSIWILAGDPAGGGSLDPMNETTGIMGRDAWCKDGDGNTYFVGTDGIYRIAKNLSSFDNLTMAKIPTIIEDLALDADKQIITMGYDGRQHGLVISVTTREDGSNDNFWYDLRTGGFFPEDYADSNGLFSQHYYKADNPEYKRLIVGCNDGYIRTFDTVEKNDDATVMIDDLVGHWKMNDDAATKVVVDSSSNSNDGASIQNTEDVSVAGKINGALSFDSASFDFVQSDYDATGVTNISFSMWVKPTTDIGIKALAGPSSWGNDFFILRRSAQKFYITTRRTSGTSYTVTSGNYPADGSWYHVVGSLDIANQVLNLYVNGIAMTPASTPTASGAINADWVKFEIGRSAGAHHFDGDIDDVRIYNKELTLAEVVGIYNDGDGTEGVPQVQEPIDSYAVLGPKPLSTDDFANTQITDLVMISGGGAVGGSELDTDGLTMDLHVKDTSEEVTEAIKADATPQYTYTQSGPGRAQNQRPRITGLVAGIKLSNAKLGETWAIEKVTTKTKPFGRKK